MEKITKIGLSGLLVIVAIGLVVIGLLSRFAARSATGRTDTRVPIYTLTDSFTADQLNSRMWISPDSLFHPADSLTRLLPIIRRQFRPNANASVLQYGNSARVPVGWAAIDLRNATGQAQTLVLSMPHYRCTQATLFVGRGNRFDSVGTVQKTSPLQRAVFLRWHHDRRERRRRWYWLYPAHPQRQWYRHPEHLQTGGFVGHRGTVRCRAQWDQCLTQNSFT